MGAWIEIAITATIGTLRTKVAPFMGAWIEIRQRLRLSQSQVSSHPSWVRGLKFPKKLDDDLFSAVAPFMGAWIEIRGAI